MSSRDNIYKQHVPRSGPTIWIIFTNTGCIPKYQGKQEMLNSYLKQMLLISNMERGKFVILQHLLSNSHYYVSYRKRLCNNKEENERQLKQQELAKGEKQRLKRERDEEDKEHLC